MDFKAARLAARMSQAHLAKAAGVSRRTIVRAEGGEVLSAETARCLTAVLGGGGGPARVGAVEERGPASLVAMGWIDDCSIDSMRYAAVYAFKHFGHYGALYAGVTPYKGGFIWEAQEGGGGTSHLEDAAQALDGNGGWFLTSNRVFTVTMMDGRPCFLLHAQSWPPDVTGMRDMRWGRTRLTMIRAAFDPLRPGAHRDVVAACGCGSHTARAPFMMSKDRASAELIRMQEAMRR